MDEFWLGMTTTSDIFYDNKWAKELFDVEILYDILKSRSERISPVTLLNMQIRLYLYLQWGGGGY